MPAAELFAACEAGKEEEVRAILKQAGAHGILQRLLLRRQHGCTVMHRAAAFGHFRVVTELLARGADANAITAAGVTPLHMGSECGHNDVVDVLVAFGAAQPPDDFGSTPLHRAAFAGSVEIVAMLLEGGGIEDARDVNGHTPLHVAAHCGVSSKRARQLNRHRSRWYLLANARVYWTSFEHTTLGSIWMSSASSCEEGRPLVWSTSTARRHGCWQLVPGNHEWWSAWITSWPPWMSRGF